MMTGWMFLKVVVMMYVDGAFMPADSEEGVKEGSQVIRKLL